MTINDVLNEGESLLLEAGINYKGPKPKTAKVLFHDDMDGVMSAVAISMQIKKQFGISTDSITYAALSDKNYKNSNEKLLKKVDGQLLVVVDFNRFEKDADTKNIDVATDHHVQDDPDAKRKGLRVATSFKSDAEHISSKIARGFMNGTDIKAVSAVDSASFGKNLFVNHTLDLDLALKGEKTGEKKIRLAIVSNILLNQIVRAYKTKDLNVVYGIIKKISNNPTMIKLYSTLKTEIKKLKLKVPEMRDIEDYKKDNKKRVAKSMDVDEKGEHTIKKGKPGDKENDVSKDSRFPDIATNKTFGGDGRYDAFLDKSVKSAFRDYGAFWQVSKRPAGKMSGNLIKVSQDAFRKAMAEHAGMDNIKSKFYFANTEWTELKKLINSSLQKDYDKIGGHEAISNIGYVNTKTDLERFFKLSSLKSAGKGPADKLKSFERKHMSTVLKSKSVMDSFHAFRSDEIRGKKDKMSGNQKKLKPEEFTIEALTDYQKKNDPWGSKMAKARTASKKNSNIGFENKFWMSISNQLAMIAKKELGDEGMKNLFGNAGSTGKDIGKKQGAINKFLKGFKTSVNYEIKSKVQGIINKDKKSIKESFVSTMRKNAGLLIN